jgi:uncharacterized SAM-binding protein YcdF (DUF218 family)
LRASEDIALDAPVRAQPVPPGDVVVVLGCRVETSGAMSAAMARRATWGLAAIRSGLASSIIPSGGRRWGEHVEAEVLSRAFVAAGIPSDRIFPELSSLTTVENAMFSAALLRRLSARRAIIVTCAWHMPRALSSFRAAGVRCVALSAPTPPASMATRLKRAVHEQLSSRLDRYNLERIAAVRARGDVHPFDVHS